MSDSSKEARAEAKGAKAKAQALRPWYKRPGRVTLVILAAVIVISVASQSNKSKKTTPVAASSSASSTTVSKKKATSTTRVSTTPSTSVAVTKATVSSASGIGQVAKDGDFAFVVKGVSCGAQAAGAVNSGGIGETVPSGALECIVTMSVTNDKSQAQTFFDSNQYAYDAKGRQFSADLNGSIYLTGDQDGNQINPGITVTAPVPFQIPAGDTIVKMVLHDSEFSGGVTVRV